MTQSLTAPEPLAVVDDGTQELLDALVRLVEQQSREMRASVLLLAPNGRTLVHGAAPSLPERYCRAIDGLSIGPAAGSCGTAAYRRQPVVVTDIATDPLWVSYRELAAAHGLAACWSTPFFAGDGACLGTFAMYYATPRAPTPADEELILVAARMAAAIVERERVATEQRRDAEALRRQRHLLHTVTTNATSALFMMDRRGRCTFMNPAAERMTGWTVADIGDRCLHDVVHHTYPDGRPFPIDDCPIDRALLTERPLREYEGVFVRRDGTFFPVCCAASPIIERGVPVGTVVEVRDVTEEQKAAAELRRAKEIAEQASNAKSEFLAVMSHELRTPLNAIGGYTDLLAMGIRGPVTEEQQKDLARIRDSQRHLLLLINDLLDFAKIDAGHLEYDLRPVPLATSFEQAGNVIRPLADEKQLKIELSAVDEALAVHADPDRLQQILLNLLANAVKFTPAKGSVSLFADVADEEVAIHVHDTGIGIPAARVEQIFEPFVQVEPGRRNNAGGVGLGLAISRDLARGMGGDLTVESIEGAGSTFTLKLARDQLNV